MGNIFAVILAKRDWSEAVAVVDVQLAIVLEALVPVVGCEKIVIQSVVVHLTVGSSSVRGGRAFAQ